LHIFFFFLSFLLIYSKEKDLHAGSSHVASLSLQLGLKKGNLSKKKKKKKKKQSRKKKGNLSEKRHFSHFGGMAQNKAQNKQNGKKF
jgi:hypothetical protein